MAVTDRSHAATATLSAKIPRSWLAASSIIRPADLRRWFRLRVVGSRSSTGLAASKVWPTGHRGPLPNAQSGASPILFSATPCAVTISGTTVPGSGMTRTVHVV